MIDKVEIMMMERCGQIQWICCLTPAQVREVIRLFGNATDNEIVDVMNYICRCAGGGGGGGGGNTPFPTLPQPGQTPQLPQPGGGGGQPFPNPPQDPGFPAPGPLPQPTPNPSPGPVQQGCAERASAYLCSASGMTSVGAAIAGIAAISASGSISAETKLALDGLRAQLLQIVNDCGFHQGISESGLARLCKTIEDTKDGLSHLPEPQSTVSLAMFNRLIPKELEDIMDECCGKDGSTTVVVNKPPPVYAQPSDQLRLDPAVQQTLARLNLG